MNTRKMNARKTNARKLIVSVLMLVSVLLSACARATATPPSIPATDTLVMPTATAVPTATIVPTETPVLMPTPLTAVVLAEWKINMPQDIAFGFGSVWVPSHRDPNATTRIDPVTNKVISVIQKTGYRSHSTLIVDDSVWVDGEYNDMAKIDPKTNTVVAQVAGGHTSLVYGFGSIWSTTRTDELDRIDPATAKRIIVPIQLGDGKVDYNNEVVVSASAVWVEHEDEGELIKIDPATNNIVSRIPYTKIIEEAKAQTTIPAGKGTNFLWLVLESPGVTYGLVRIDPNTGAGLTFLPHVRTAIAVTDDAVWVANDNVNRPQLIRLNVATNQVDATYTIRSGVTQIGIGFGSVWVVYGGSLQRLDITP